MKKNKWWMLPVILLAVFGLLIMGCPTDSKKSSDGDKKEEVDPTHNYAGGDGVTDVVMFDNFKYGTGYQSWGDDDKQIAWSRLANVDIVQGDTYSFKVKFTLDRDLEDPLYVAFVNQPTAGSWSPMYSEDTGWVDVENDKLVKVEGWDADATKVIADADLDGPGIYKKDAVIEAEFSVTATKSGSAATAVLVFQTRGTGTKGTAGSGVKKEVTMTFTELFIAQGEFVEIETPAKEKLPKPAIGEVTLPTTMTWKNGDTDDDPPVWKGQQGGWKSIGFEGANEGPTVAQFVWAKSLVLTVGTAPTGGMQFVWQGDGMDGWHQYDILTNSGGAIEGKTTVSGTTITIDLAGAMGDDYDTVDKDGESVGYVWGKNGVKLLIAYYSLTGTTVEDWITSAKLVIE